MGREELVELVEYVINIEHQYRLNKINRDERDRLYEKKIDEIWGKTILEESRINNKNLNYYLELI